MNVFLGGTCNKSQWREQLIPLLKIEYFNPVLDGSWTTAAMEEEIKQRATCDFVLYVLTPRMNGFYSIAEVVDDSNKRPQKTVFLVLEEDFNDDGEPIGFNAFQLKSFRAIERMVSENGAFVAKTLEGVAVYLNGSVNTKI